MLLSLLGRIAVDGYLYPKMARTSGGRHTIVYIMGYGRSGSTILDILLSNADDTTGVGEVADVYTWAERGLPCACGSALDQCGFWKPILKSHFEHAQGRSRAEFVQVQRRVESHRRFPLIALRLLGRDTVANYGEQMNSLFGEVFERSKASWVVDSSKTSTPLIGRPLSLSRYTRFDVKGIFLTRDGRGVAWSEMKRTGSEERVPRFNSQAMRFWKTVACWVVSNVLTCVSALLMGSKNVLRVRYEDLCEAPVQTLRRISEFTGQDLTRVIGTVQQAGELAVGHNVAGNRVRFSKQLRFRPDYEWQEKMPKRFQAAFWLTAWPLALALGYSRTPSTAEPDAGAQPLPQSR